MTSKINYIPKQQASPQQGFGIQKIKYIYNIDLKEVSQRVEDGVKSALKDWETSVQGCSVELKEFITDMLACKVTELAHNLKGATEATIKAHVQKWFEDFSKQQNEDYKEFINTIVEQIKEHNDEQLKGFLSSEHAQINDKIDNVYKLLESNSKERFAELDELMKQILKFIKPNEEETIEITEDPFSGIHAKWTNLQTIMDKLRNIKACD